MHRRLIWLLSLPALLVSCPGNEVERYLTPPQVIIVAPDDTEGPVSFFQGDTVEFVASVSDSYDPVADIVVTWDTTWLDTEGMQQQQDLGSTPVEDDGRTTLLLSAMEVGTHTVRCTATDTDGMSAADFVNITISTTDEDPTVEIGSPEEGDTFDEGDPVDLLAVATDDGNVAELTIAWHSVIDGYLGGNPPNPNGLSTLTATELSPGEQEITVWATDAAGNSASDMVTITVIPLNQPPTDPVVYITPPGPMTDEDLICVAAGSNDPEGSAVTYEFAWDQDGTPTGWAADTVPAEHTIQGELWTCRAVAVDDEGAASNEMSASVVIENSLPSYTSVTLDPSPAYELDTLQCSPFGWSDPDGDPEGAQYEWYVDAALVGGAAGATLNGTDFDHFQVVECLVYPDDGVDLGFPLTSNPVDVLNTIPEAPTIEIQPDPLDVNQDAVCAITALAYDPDPDTQTYEYEWYEDGVFQPALTTDSVPAGTLDLGEEWSCRARAFDDYDYGPWAEAAAQVLPHAGDVVITEFMVDPDFVDDTVGEYIELFNASPEVIWLDGWVIGDGVNDSHVINSGGQAFFYPGAYFVLANNANLATNGGVVVDYQYAGITLDQGFDAVELSYDGAVVDEVVYDWGGTFPVATGASFSLDPNTLDAVSNDDGANWCRATNPLGAEADFGTPGSANDSCACGDSDDDGDGYGDDPACDPAWLDCNDNDPDVHPGAFDVCEDGIDNDCDGADRSCDCAETDLDGDGYGTAAACPDPDCDDSDPYVYPTAPEICNAIDDDCDGDIDEGYDGDADGVSTCGGDCDDNNDAIFPGNPEVCDGFDNDCNAVIDDGLNIPGCTLYYQDVDGDGYGVDAFYQCACEVDGNYNTEESGDCDDANPGIYPGAPEICDLVDNDCDGSVDEEWVDCVVDNGVAGCVAGECVIDSCDTGFYDMDLDPFNGCEAEEDIYETIGGDSCLSPVDAFGNLTDNPTSILSIQANIVPQYDEDWYLLHAVDLPDVDGDCDPFDVSVYFSSNPDDRFRFEIYHENCATFDWTHPVTGQYTACGTNLTNFDFEVDGECPCMNDPAPTEGYSECTDNSFDFLIRIYQVSGPDDDTTYTLSVTNG